MDSGNVHNDGWEKLLLREIYRQQAQGKEVAFRRDAAFAKLEFYERSESATLGMRPAFSPNDNLEHLISELLTRTVAQLAAGGPLQELSPAGSELDQGT